MGILVDGQWRDEELPRRPARPAISSGWTAFSATASPPTAHRASRPKPAAIISTSPTPARGRTARRFFARSRNSRARSPSPTPFPGFAQQGWTFEDNAAFPDCTPDRVNGFHYLHEAYTASDPHYTGKVTVPTLWDKKTRRIVNNEFSEIIRMLNSEFAGIGADPTDFYPKRCAARSTASTTQVYANVNNGVYRCGFARSQAAYEAAYDALFATLDEIEARLGRQRYLVGHQITEADWRLFPTLVRFDVAYFSLFKCNRNRIADYPNLLNYMRELYQVPGIAETVKPRYYVMGYYSITRVNPTGIIPKGTPVDFRQPHDRARFAA